MLPGSAIVLACLTVALLLASASNGRGTRDRPPPGYTGGFGEPSCAQCHFAADANAGDGSLDLSGVPAGYDAGETYTLHVTVTDAGLRAGGFQLAARFDDGRQAGRLADVDTLRTGVTVANGVQYIHHLYDGTDPVAPDTARWIVEWTAPESGGPVSFHAAANASNGDDSALGDWIYVTSRRIPPEK